MKFLLYFQLISNHILRKGDMLQMRQTAYITTARHFSLAASYHALCGIPILLSIVQIFSSIHIW